jgi:hypothetical protein
MNAEATKVVHTPTQPSQTLNPQNSEKRRGDLVRKVFDVVQIKAAPVTAKDVTQAMEAEGFPFDADDPQIAVSKALRQLAKQKKIHAEKGAHAKAAIIYNAFLSHQVPVRENARNHGGSG